MLTTSDLHHCRCFKIAPEDIKNCKKGLERIGFQEPLAQMGNEQQVFGLTAPITDLLQIHTKVMNDGTIEGELEPPADYPGAHLNQIHSYSAHKEIKMILDDIGIPYVIPSSIPDTCLAPRIIRPDRPMHAATMIGLGILGVLGGLLIREAMREDDSED